MKSTAALEPTSARLLHAIRQTLAQRLAPQLTDGHALALIAAVDVALSELLRRAEKGSDALRPSCSAWYRDAGGQPIDESSVRYYSVLRVYSRLLVGNIALETKFARDPTAEIEYLFLGGPVRRYFLGDYMTCLETITS